jgi:hypothetical protein
MKLFRRARLLLLSAPLVIGGLALGASPASAFALPPPSTVYPIYAPGGNLILAVPQASHPWSCPILDIAGAKFGTNDNVLVTLRTVNPGVWWPGLPAAEPNYAYNVSLLWSTDSLGNLIITPPFPANKTSGFQYWQVVASENGHFDSFSNIVECAP